MKTKKSMLLFLVLLFSYITVSAQSANITQGQEVDLGLSVNWAGWNVGASSPEEYGDLFAWGETSPKSGDYTKSTYRYHNGNSYVNIGINISGTQYDAARVNWGGSWRMPTKAEFEELKNRCTWKWTTYKGINGMKVTGPNGNSIFLPAAGCRYGTLSYRGSLGDYWSGSLDESYSSDAWNLLFGSDGSFVYNGSREYGQSVRPVKNKGTVKKATSNKPSTQRSQNKTKQNSEIDYNKMSIKQLQDRIRELRKDGTTSAERREIMKITEIISRKLKVKELQDKLNDLTRQKKELQDRKKELEKDGITLAERWEILRINGNIRLLNGKMSRLMAR